MSKKYYNVGKLVNTHGLRGEVKILPQTDFADSRFAPGSKLSLQHPDNGQSLVVEVVSAKEHKGMYIVKLKGYNDINEVEKYKGWVLKIAEDELEDLEDGEYYYHEIIGCKVVTEDGEELGNISDILRPGANDVWVVDMPKKKQLLLPIIDEVLLKVDVANKTVTVRLLEGLI
ncbi:ribosome maturation factor RimM [Paenibacillus glycanilyticus]|uniref:Ribosome maturation factor RimM n=1 Tax=Paenibacillus glycanilyticus TaxID=126569 RepID=A0ABQ6GNJ7_9BACL|nr:ribosome maturation factor RimM [Paenibacillus glycanilyticus]GLX71177.1 ribosome maturation factor RimM [Paenibacillus glycanilyticus]